MASEGERVTDESLKLLLQVAYGDGAIAPEEARLVRSFAERAGASAAFRGELEAYLTGRLPLPAPDLGLLRRYRQGCLAMAELVTRADGFVTDDERDVVREIETLLDAR